MPARLLIAACVALAACGRGSGSCPDPGFTPIGFFDCHGFPSQCTFETPERLVQCTCDDSTGIGFCCDTSAPPTCGSPQPGLPCCPSSLACEGPNGSVCTCSGLWQCTPPDRDLGVDLAMATGCAGVLECATKCGDPINACVDGCAIGLPPSSMAVFASLEDCLSGACDVAGPDAGFLAACNGIDNTECRTCLAEAQTGTSPSGATTFNVCCTTFDPQVVACAQPASDPVCGRCVDQLFACMNDH